jgi:hypothetical protein
MEKNEPVMVKILSGTSALDFDAVFTGEVVRAREVWDNSTSSTFSI